jgi:uncharacterized protein
MMQDKRIAIIGSGIAGMAAGHYLTEQGHEVHLFEAGLRLGGHTATIDVEHRGERLAIDTGFIVFNDWTYPHFIGLLDKLGVASQPTSMSFSVSDPLSGIEYAGSSLNTLFAQRRNLLSPAFLRMVRDILRFNRTAEAHAQDPALASLTLGEYLQRFAYSREFRAWYLLPMGAAIWSSGQAVMEAFPLQFFVRFFRNHGLLNLRERPQWRVLCGGSRSYIGPLTASYHQRIHPGTPVLEVHRQPQPGLGRVCVSSSRGQEYFDEVVFACHSDQALRLLADPTPAEQSVLGAIPYTRNEVVLHTDSRLLPRNRRCWSSWNVSLGSDPAAPPTLTYDMNILQGLDSSETWCVTLNQREGIDPRRIVGVYHYEHPLFSLAGIAAQQRWQEINGVNGTWYCGAWWRNGFHEDGVWSALRVAEGLAAQQTPDTAPLARVG